MFNQLKSLLWLRKRVIKSNKTIILQILLPLGFAFLTNISMRFKVA